ncbi:MAG TPA: zinc-binding dehydrogenase, partial [Acidimicrobiia bacterium]|nr:zinc-binding dehydrogenase [Acidimicrobiia bacterium]
SGLQWSDYRERDPAWVARVQAEIFDMHGNGLLEPLVSRILPLERYATALSLLRDGRAQGKIILRVGDG